MITINKTNNQFHIDIKAILYNDSKQKLDLTSIKNEIILQTKKVYNVAALNLSCTIAIEIVSEVVHIKRDKLLFHIVDFIEERIPAESVMGHLRIKLSAKYIQEMLSNKRTIPHEIGHCFGWNHPHARGQHLVTNLESNIKYEQSMSEAERGTNLMSQSWYIEASKTHANESMNITKNQILLLHENYIQKKINKCSHLKGFWIFKKLIN